MAKRLSTTSQRDASDEDLACAEDLMEVMPMVMGAMRATMRQQLGGAMTVPQFRCLNFIGRNPDCSVSALAAFMGTTCLLYTSPSPRD